MHIPIESLLLVQLCKGLILKTCQKKKPGAKLVPHKFQTSSLLLWAPLCMCYHSVPFQPSLLRPNLSSSTLSSSPGLSTLPNQAVNLYTSFHTEPAHLPNIITNILCSLAFIILSNTICCRKLTCLLLCALRGPLSLLILCSQATIMQAILDCSYADVAPCGSIFFPDLASALGRRTSMDHLRCRE